MLTCGNVFLLCNVCHAVKMTYHFLMKKLKLGSDFIALIRLLKRTANSDTHYI